MMDCYKCGFWDSEREVCTCPSVDKWYACPIESEKSENKELLEEFAEECEKSSWFLVTLWEAFGTESEE